MKPAIQLSPHSLARVPLLFSLLLGLAMPIASGAATNSLPKGRVWDVATGKEVMLLAPESAERGTGRTAVDWQDPDKVLAHVNYDGLPITEVGKDLKEQFGGAFDVLFPNGPGLPGQNWSDTQVTLQLMNVKASEIFNAMNMVFETGRTPLHWDLTMNGHRPAAVLRILYPNPDVPAALDPTTGLPVQPAAADKPMVFFVGDLLGDPRSPGMTMDQIVQTVKEVYAMANRRPENIACHKEAQLLVIRGAPDDFGFVQSILESLRNKLQMDKHRADLLGEGHNKPKGETNTP